MDMKIKYIDNNLFISDKLITFDYNIENIIEVYDLIIVLLKIPFNVNDVYYNVFAFSLDGDIKWRVDDPNLKGFYESKAPFTGMGIIDDYIVANDFYARRSFININTGIIEHRDVTK